jgi:hypothetical protein
MAELLERAVETVRALPPEAQDALARILLQLTGDDETVIPLTAEEEASLDEALAQAERGEFATDEQVRHLGEAWAVKLRYTPRAATELDKVLSDIELESRGRFA